ncbi:MAG: Tryptophan-rich sensory protein [uncultured Pseudonocardia sp.]|uniref:Tryptophan-rich sensory protein n=1 Tax=uncultured Pseudonocardia sp. TaxID=211455 RepID=A0A6J4NSZ6_9PSEU|nr:MAG: Tryptophan-rich sensory protein [uncultured Pseudonocardia sp.]
MSTLDPRPTLSSRALGMGAFVAAAVVAAASGALTSTGAAEQYGALVQPTWAPPPWLFGPVWTVLYALIAVSGWLVWRRAGWSGGRTALTVYAVQLVLNALWTPLFFGAGLLGVAFAEILLLWVAIIATIVLFARHSRIAAAMLVPYLVWVSFAAALNLAIWMLN